MKQKYEELIEGDLIKYSSKIHSDELGFGIVIGRIRNPIDPFEEECYYVYMINNENYYMIHQSSIVKV